jgi:hypothetical protein
VTLADKDATASGCSSGLALSYKSVRVDVTWPDIGSRKPVRADTLRAVGVGTSSALKGTAQVTVSGYDGPLPGLSVTMTPASGTVPAPQDTLDDGCASFSGLTPGSFTAGVSATGYVGTTNSQIVTQSSVAVSSTAPVRPNLTYAAARSAIVALDLPVGSTLATGVPLRLGGTYVTEHTIPTCISTSTSECITGLPGTLKNLYPDTYTTVKAGVCTETSPSSSSVALTGAATVVPTVTVPLGAITVRVQNLLGTPIVGRAVTFSHAAPATGCAGETYTTPSVAAGSMIALPYGTWTVTTTSLTAGIGAILTRSVIVGPLARTGSAVLTVIT